MKWFNALNITLTALAAVCAFNCRELLQDDEIQYLDWTNLEQCLAEVNSKTVPKNMSENIWRLMKIAFDGIENIPLDAYKKLGLTITAIPDADIRNISMEQVEVVEAFGVIRSSDKVPRFSDEQMRTIAQKVRQEWLGKNPRTYSEYDLMSMGEILCYLNESDIAAIHADAFKEAAETIGTIEHCPPQGLQALAKLAMREEAFGAVSRWTKIEVSTIGNILNGLSPTDIASIDKDKLHLNRYYAQQHRNNTPRHNFRPSGNISLQLDSKTGSAEDLTAK